MWPGGVAGGPWVAETELLGLVFPTVVDGRAVGDGAPPAVEAVLDTGGCDGLAVPVGVAAAWPVRPAADVLDGAGRVATAGAAVSAGGLFDVDVVLAGPPFGTPGTGSRAEGGIGPPASPMPNRHA